MKYIYSFHHDDAGFFLKPNFADLDPKAALSDFVRSLKLQAEEYSKGQISHCSFWYLGSFDDDKGVFDQSQQAELLSRQDIAKVIREALVSVEGLEDGKPGQGN